MSEIENEEKQIPAIELLTPLTAEFHRDGSAYDYQDESDKMELMNGEDLVPYEKAIQAMVVKENSQGSVKGKNFNLMNCFNGSETIKDKVENATVSVKSINAVLYGCTTLILREFLESQELNEICTYITSQYSDGWGKGFEQRAIAVDGGYLHVHFGQGNETKFQQRTLETLSEMPINKPRLKLLGHDGNIFSIMGDASRLLRKQGKEKEVAEMVQRVTQSGDYYAALGIISEYVETELSVKNPEIPSKKKKQPER